METLFEIEVHFPTGVKDEWRLVKNVEQTKSKVLNAAEELVLRNCIDPLILERFRHQIRLRQFHTAFNLYVDVPDEVLTNGREYPPRFQVMVTYPAWPQRRLDHAAQPEAAAKRPLPLVSPQVSSTQAPPPIKRIKRNESSEQSELLNEPKSSTSSQGPSWTEPFSEDDSNPPSESQLCGPADGRASEAPSSQEEDSADLDIHDSGGGGGGITVTVKGECPPVASPVVVGEAENSSQLHYGGGGCQRDDDGLFDVFAILDSMPFAHTDRRLIALRNLATCGQDLPDSMVKNASQLFGKWLVYNTACPDWKPDHCDLRKMARTLSHCFPNTTPEFWFRERPCNGKLYNVIKNTRNRDERLLQLRKRQKGAPFSFADERLLDERLLAADIDDGYCVIEPTVEFSGTD